MDTEKGPDGFDEQVGVIAALGEPIRRALYRYVVAQREPVGRDEAAAATGVARHTVKFHLDRLEADGLLESEYSRPAGRRGPGAGRPAKRYRRSAREVAVSLPGRRYDIAARVMAQAVEAATRTGAAVADALRESAAGEGRALGEQARARHRPSAGRAARLRAISGVLAEHGYEPYSHDGIITLANCPFDALSREHPDLVCGMNLDLMRGMLDACGSGDLHARLDPAPGRCCVTLDGRRA